MSKVCIILFKVNYVKMYTETKYTETVFTETMYIFAI